MNRIIILALSGACAFGQVYHVNFSTSSPLDYAAGNGSFASDLYNNQRGFLEIGGLGNANSGGLILTPEFGPIDYTQGHGTFGDFRQTETITYEVPNPNFDPNRPIGLFNPGPPTFERTRTVQTGELIGAAFSLRAAPGIGSEPWRVSIFDVDGDAYSFTITPTTAPGVFWTYNVPMEDESMPEMDWTQVNRISIGGDGDGDPFHAAFDTMSLSVIPEPSEYIALFGIGLAAFAVVRKRFC